MWTGGLEFPSRRSVMIAFPLPFTFCSKFPARVGKCAKGQTSHPILEGWSSPSRDRETSAGSSLPPYYVSLQTVSLHPPVRVPTPVQAEDAVQKMPTSEPSLSSVSTANASTSTSECARTRSVDTTTPPDWSSSSAATATPFSSSSPSPCSPVAVRSLTRLLLSGPVARKRARCARWTPLGSYKR